MSADFWAGYVSGAVGILVGNPLDIIKTRLQAGSSTSAAKVSVTAGLSSASGTSTTSTTSPVSFATPQDIAKRSTQWSNLVRGSAAPILGYGALNALLFMTYNRSLSFLETGTLDSTAPSMPSPWSIYTAGALGGLATFVVSAPTELVKCRAQISQVSSLQVTRELWQAGGLRGIYLGGGITSIRDAVGYGFYFWSYELSKDYLTSPEESSNIAALKVLFCGGLAGVVTWASIFPLDVVKTRVQTWDLVAANGACHVDRAEQPLIGKAITARRPSALYLAQQAYKAEGASVFFRGLGVCSLRAFIVNAVQWAIYEWMMKVLAT